jgi:leucyl aminopeptidase
VILIHQDIAGASRQSDAIPWNEMISTGVVIRTLVDLAMKFGSNGPLGK